MKPRYKIFGSRFRILRNFVGDILVILAVLTYGIAVEAHDLTPPDTLAREIQLPGVDVRPVKEHYTKKNNPAVDLMKRLREASRHNSPYNNSHYNYRAYELTVIGLDGVGDSIGGHGQFSFLKNYVDTSAVTGSRYLPLSVKENLSYRYFRKDPRAEKRLIYGIRSEGMDDVFDLANVQTVLEDLFDEIDVFGNDIDLLGNRFVSPFSAIGSDFYKYYIGDTITADDGSRLAALQFAPRNHASFGFVGTIFYDPADSVMSISAIDLKLPKVANVNFVESLRLSQKFAKAVNGSRIKTSDAMTLQLAAIPGTKGIVIQRTSRYNGHTFSPSSREDILDRQGDTFTTADAWLHDDEYWNENRIGSVPDKDLQMASMMKQMRSVGVYRWGERILRAIISGYIPTGEPPKVEIGPINSMLSFNDVEGTRMRLGGLTTAALDNRIFLRGYGAYGTKDHKWKYHGEVEFSFIPKKSHAREFPMRLLRLSHTYDTDAPGQHFTFTNPDNLFLSLRREKDTLMIYQRDTRLEYIHELPSRLSFSAALFTRRDFATRYLPFVGSAGESLRHIDYSGATVGLRYAPEEKFYQTRSYRIPINMDSPVFQLSHTYVPGGILGNRFTVNRTDVAFMKRFWLSAFGYIDLTLKGSHVWSRTPFTNLIIPNANLSYVIQPETYALLNPMEFILDSYAAVDFTYWANGAILNNVPLVKKLKLREVFSFSAFWGHLSRNNDPLRHPELPMFPASTQSIGTTPYMEVSAGLDNILRILRLEYVWRLSYRHNPGIDRSGLRVALHLTF